MKRQILVGLLSLSVLFFCYPANASINVSGHISTNTFWFITQDVYQVVGDLTIDSGATLTLASGVRLRTGSNYNQNIYVNGSLVGNGAAIETMGWPSWLHVQSGGHLDLTGGDVNVNGSNGYPSIDVGNGGVANLTGVMFLSGARLIYESGSSGSMTNNTIGYVEVAGASSVTITGNTFTDDYPIRINGPDGCSVSGTGNTFTSADPWIYIAGVLSNSRQLGFADPALGKYQVSGDLTVASGATLTLASGVRLRTGSNYNQNIYVNGSLVGNGAAIETMGWPSWLHVQSGGHLDLTGGDVNVNGSNGYPSIDVGNGGVANLTGVMFLSGARLIYESGSSGSMTNNTIGYVEVAGASSVTITGNTFTDDYPIRINGPDGCSVSGTGNTFTSADPWIYIAGVLSNSRQLGFADPALGKYQVSGDLTVASGATLTLASGVRLRTGSNYNQNIYVNGSLVGNGAAIETMGWPSWLHVQSGGHLDLTGGDVNVNGSNGYPSIDVGNGGVANLTGVMFLSGARLIYENGSSGMVKWNVLNYLSVDSNSKVSVINNDFSQGSVTVSGDPSATINMGNNWWGTTNQNQIEAKITHHPDNPSLPLVDYAPWRTSSPLNFCIIAQWPEGRSNQANNYIEIGFNKEINVSAFNPADVTITGSNGVITATGIEAIDTTALGCKVYRILFSETLTDGTYVVRIQPNIRSLEGSLLDQDGDGVGGEPEDDIYEDRFVIDTSGPYIVNQNPAGDIAGTVDHVDVWFSEKINSQTVTSDSVFIFGPDGYIPPTSLTEIGVGTYRVEFPAQTAYGQYYVVIAPDVEDIAGNLMDQNRNGINGEYLDDIYEASFNLTDVDLTISNVVANATELSPGKTITVSWNGANHSGMPLLGSWTDAVYLSADDKWDIDDKLLATVPHTGGLSQDEVYSQQINVPIPGSLPGNYYIIVRADLCNQEKGGNKGNNIVAIGPIPLKIKELLANGVSISSSLDNTNQSDYYAIQGGSGNNLAIALEQTDPNSVVKFFIGYESIPTQLNFDFSSTANGINKQGSVIAGTMPGTYYLLVQGELFTGASSYNLKADTPEIAISAINPIHHGTGSICTMTLTGSGFDSNTAIEFHGSGGSNWTPTSTQVISPTIMTVTLNTPTWPLDTYDLVATKPGGISYGLTNVFTVTSGASNFEAQVVTPDSMGRHWLSTIWLEYANTGESSMPAPLLKLYASDNAILTLDPTIATQGLWTSTPPSGTSDTIQVMTTGSGATPGILQPGDSIRIPIYYLGIKQPWDFSVNSIEFNLGYLRVDYPETIDWASLKEQMRPETIPSDAWDAVWINFTTPIGNIWGNYTAMLNSNTNYLHNIGQDVSDISSLLAFEFQQASAISPYTYLAGDVDAYLPAPGLPLVFSRVYGQSIISRYGLSTFGRGWRHSWDIYAQVLSNGDVVVRGTGGMDRYFSNEGNGSYKASAGDYGNLTLSSGKYCLTEKYGTVWQFRADDNLLDYVQDRNGNRITAGYTSGWLTSITHSNGEQLLLDYNANGQIWHVTDPRGAGSGGDKVTTFEYDSSGQYLLSVTAPGNRVTSYTYQTTGSLQQKHALLSIGYPDSSHDYFTYDANGQLAERHSDGGTESVTYSYSVGKVTATDATGRQTIFYFGLGGQLVKACDGAGNSISMSYDHNYQLTQLTGASSQQYNYSYDSQGNMTAIKDPVKKTTSFSYQPSFNNLAGFTDSRGNGIEYGYDSSGNLASITYQDGTSESFTYDSGGNVLTWTNRRGATVTYTYNTKGQVTSKDYSDTPGVIDFTYDYDSAGNLTSATDANGNTTTMTYAPDTDWLTRIVYPGGHFFNYEYDNLGRRTRRTDDSNNIVNYIYDTLGRLYQMTNGSNGLIVDYEYDSAGRLTHKTLGNGVYSTYDYDVSGHLTHLVNYKPGNTILSRFDYTYDADGKRTSMTTLDGTYTYGYDPLGQLTSVAYPNGRRVTYAYDSVGNRIDVNDNGSLTIYATNNMNQYTVAGDTAYTYDADGGLKTKTEGGITTTYTYDVENRLIGVSTPTDTWNYTYDAFGNRTASSHNGVKTNYIVDPIGFGNVAAEYDGSGNLVARYDHGYGLLARADATGIPAYYTFDAIGSTSEVTNISAAVLNSYNYDPFGIYLSKTETINNPFEYVGEYGVMHEASGLEFMRARYYTPDMGRFLGVDPVRIPEFGTNLYSYCFNNPILRIDPRGLQIVLQVIPVPGSYPYPRDYRWWRNIWPDIPIESIAGTGIMSFDLDGPSGDQKDNSRVPIYFTSSSFSFPLYTGNHGNFPYGYDPDPQYPKQPKFPWWLKHLPTLPTQPVGDSKGALVWLLDPNKKIGPKGYGQRNFIRSDSLMAYEVQFENESDATAPAHIITITDVLDEHLDVNTFELEEIAFAGNTLAIPHGLSSYQTTMDIVVDNEYISQAKLRVEVDVSLDINSRELTCTLRGLDPNTGWLPENILLGILYPNDANGRGDGHISFTIKQIAGLPSGTQILNQALIYFDWNDAIETETVLNTIDANAPSSAVLALPAESNDLGVTINWNGTDGTNGSGVSSYDVYVSDNSGKYTLWLSDVNQTSALFIGEHGHTYSFYSVAKDNVGNIEIIPTTGEATITTYGRNPPQVVGVAINEGQAQRSRIGTLTVQFSKNVVVSKEALYIYNNTVGAPVDLSGLAASDFGYDSNTFIATWNLSAIVLADANYTAALLATKIRDAGYNPLDGNLDGVGGDDYAFAFFKLFGDLDGNGQVDFADYSIFASKWLDTTCDGPYWCGGVDEEPDGAIGLTDLAGFCENWLTTIE